MLTPCVDLESRLSDSYDALVLVSFGGPEKREDVIPFLENVLRGRNVPRERMLAVAEHYYHFDGVSPINAHCRELLAALGREFDAHGLRLPIYWGNRNWHPMLEDTVRQMTADGVRHALALATAAYSSYSSCRQYLDDIARARQVVGEAAPLIDKLRPFFNHPRFVTASIDRARTAWNALREEARTAARLVFTAHSIPLSMSRSSAYVEELQELSGLVAEALNVAPERRALVYQSRSGRPEDPWLEPDVGDHLRELKAAGVNDVVVVPVGFLSDHMEVLYDLDVEAHDLCREIGLNMIRAGTVGVHPEFVTMIRELVEERLSSRTERAAVGRLPARPDACPADCCPAPRRPGPSAGRPHG